MDKHKEESFRSKLLKERRRLLREYEKIHEENSATAGSPEDYGGDENFEDHIGDAATNIFDRERDMSLEQNIQDLLAQVDDSIRRLDAGRFGVCSRCRRPIDEARLRAIPYTALCIECKKAEEEHR